MTKTELIRQLRDMTQAGMNDCREAIEETNGDLQQAIDFIKAKGLNIADNRAGRSASEGAVFMIGGAMMEINSETDFVAQSSEFQVFGQHALATLCDKWNHHLPFQVSDVEQERQALSAVTKENIVVRRWWIEEAASPRARVFSYRHSNAKIGVLLTLLVSTVEAGCHPDVIELGDNLAMQVAAMNPIAVSADRLSTEEVGRQQKIFETQLTELKKPAAAWPKILEGKFRKWHESVCLVDQEAVWLSKTSVKQAVEAVSKSVGGEVKVVNFIRCQVGSEIEKDDKKLDEEVFKMIEQGV
jgi:elongation factor Ts